MLCLNSRIIISVLKRPYLLRGLLVSLLCFCLPTMARGDITYLPESRHHQYTSFGFFIEDQTQVVLREGGRAWGGFGGAFSLLEMSDWSLKPQLIVLASANFAFRSNSWALDFLTETFDGRFGIGVESVINPNLRFSVRLDHLSGHSADNIIDRELLDVNLGDDYLSLRLVYDYLNLLRMGVTLKPYINSDPIRQFFSADQFAEWFPWGGQDSTNRPSPFLAAGLEEDGAHTVKLNFHVQAGIYAGHHFVREYKQAIRFVIGYYNGADPRTKYARLRNSRMHFTYGGVMFNL